VIKKYKNKNTGGIKMNPYTGIKLDLKGQDPFYNADTAEEAIKGLLDMYEQSQRGTEQVQPLYKPTELSPSVTSESRLDSAAFCDAIIRDLEAALRQ
jgi:hypothetical protein